MVYTGQHGVAVEWWGVTGREQLTPEFYSQTSTGEQLRQGS